MKNFEKIEDLVDILLTRIPNFIETDFIDNGDETYTLSANFEHPKKDEDYCEQDYIFSQVTFNKDLKIIKSSFEIIWKED